MGILSRITWIIGILLDIWNLGKLLFEKEFFRFLFLRKEPVYFRSTNSAVVLQELTLVHSLNSLPLPEDDGFHFIS